MDNIYKKLISNNACDEGVLQIFTQSTDTIRQYHSGLNGSYDLKLLDIKVISGAIAGSEFAIQIISDTLRIDRGALNGGQTAIIQSTNNDNVKFFHRNGSPEIPSPIKLRQQTIRGWIDIDFQQLGTGGTDINASTWSILLTIEYKRL